MRCLRTILPACLGSCLAAQSLPEPDVTGLASLLQQEVVSVRRKRQEVHRSAAAVTVITREQIDTFGATSLADALRLAPGVHVARINSTAWGVSIRGFNGATANKLLVLVDGRSVYSPLFSGVFWDMLDYPLEEVERLEIIRGPVAAEWGANAVNGVINIITRRADRSTGSTASLSSGTDKHWGAHARHSGPLGERAAWRAYGQLVDRGQWDGPDFGREQLQDAFWRKGQAGFRLDWTRSERDSFRLHGDLALARGQSPDSMLQTQAHAGLEFSASSLNLGGAWVRSHRDGSESTLQAFVDQVDRDSAALDMRWTTLSIDWQHRRRWGRRQEWQAGVGANSVSDAMGSRSTLWFDPADKQYAQLSASLSDDITLFRDRLVLSAAARVERQPFSGFNLQPSVTLAWTPSARQTVWSSWSQALRTPTRWELHGRLRSTYTDPFLRQLPLLIKGNPAFQPEAGRSWQFGYRRQLTPTTGFDCTLFRNGYSGLSAFRTISFFGPDGVVATPVNSTRAVTWGAEVSATAQIAPAFRVSAAWSSLHYNVLADRAISDPAARQYIDRTPANLWYARAEWKPARRLRWAQYLSYAGPLAGAPAALAAVPARWRLDSHCSWSVTESGELLVTGANLFAGGRVEYFAIIHASAAIRRSLQIGWRQRF